VFNLIQHVLSNELPFYVGQSGMSSLFYNGIKSTDSILIKIHFNSIFYSFEFVPTENNNLIIKNTDHNFSENLKYTLFRRQHWRVYHFHDTSKSSKIKIEHNVSNCKALLHDASNLAAFLLRLKTNYSFEYQNIVEAVQLIAPYFKDFELEPNEYNKEHIVLRWQQKGCDDIFNASQLSDGTLRFICLATLLLQPEELKSATIIIDEPELGLHPFAITVFAEMVKKAAIQTQIILSTQSVELLNQFDVEDVIVVDRDDDGSDFKRLNADELVDWLENDYTLGDLWNKNILGGRLSR
jgi:predicted ATPase